MKVEVFVNSEKVAIVADYSSFASDHAACRGTIYKEESYAKYKTEKTFTESSRRIIEEAAKKAKELNAEVSVFDLSTFRGKIIAKLKGVNSPTWRVVE